MPLLGVWLAASGLLVLLLIGDAEILAKVAFLGRAEETESFSGRTTIWPVVQAYIDRRFWLGHGYESFWLPDVIEAVTLECQWPVRKAHSAYREMILNLGVVGLVLFCGTALAGTFAALRDYLVRRDATALFLFGMAINGFINAMFESGMVWICFPTFMMACGITRLAFFPAAAPASEPWRPRQIVGRALLPVLSLGDGQECPSYSQGSV